MSCDCCTEKFNKSTRAIVGCPNSECEYKACRECCQTYLLSQSNFGCMGCRAEWSYPHLTTQFTKTFLQGKGKFAESGGFRKHWENVIMNTEMAFFDQTTRTIQYHDIRRECNHILNVLHDDRRVLEDDLTKMNRQRRLHCKCIRKQGIKNCSCKSKEEKNKWIQERKELTNRIEEKKQELFREESRIGVVLHNARLDLTDTPEIVKTKKSFVQSCTKEGCDGFLSTAWKCRVCESYTCNKCMTIKEEGHECDPETVKTVQLCIKETKPCPKCSERIHKIDGCDQMFCTQCETLFSWNTGDIQIGGWVHAPDAVRLMRERGFLGRDARDIQCGGVPTGFEIQAWIDNIPTNKNLTEKTDRALLTDVWWIIDPIVRQLRQFEQRYVNNPQPEVNRYNRNLYERIQFLRGEITKEKWKKTLFLNEKYFLKRKDEELIKHGWYIAASDCIRNFLTMSTFDEIRAEVINLLKLMNQFNEFLEKQIYKVYGICHTRYVLMGYITSHHITSYYKNIKACDLTKTKGMHLNMGAGGVSWKQKYVINTDEIVWTPLEFQTIHVARRHTDLQLRDLLRDPAF